MCDEDGIGVEPDAADRAGAETVTLAERYATIAQDFRTEMSLLSQASMNEMPVATGAEEYCGNLVGALTQLQAHTAALGTSAQTGAADARRADDDIGTGLASVCAA